jgi:hypothetical protein
LPSNKVNAYLGSATAMTITLASLASSTTGVGRQSTEIDLTGLASTDLNPTDIVIQYKIKQGTSPTVNKGVYFYYIASDGTNRDGAAGATDAAFTIPSNLIPIAVAANSSTAATGDVLQGTFTFRAISKRFIIALYHDTVAALDATAGNHYINYYVLKSDIQASA